jgi:hypothetical protein
MPLHRVGFKPTIQVFDRMATVIGRAVKYERKIARYKNKGEILHGRLHILVF